MAFLTHRVPFDPPAEPPAPAALADAAERLNQRGGVRRLVVQLLGHWLEKHDASRPAHLLFMGAGGADLALAVGRNSHQRGRAVAITLLDSNPAALHAALGPRGETEAPLICPVAADPLSPPFDANSFDYTLASLIGHDLPDLRVMMLLRVMFKLSRRGLLWTDLLRGRWARWACRWHARGADAAAMHWLLRATDSGFTRQEVLELRRRMDLPFTQYLAAGYDRFILAGRR